VLTDLLIVALSASFIVSFLDRWMTYPMLRGLAALVLSIGGALLFDYSGWMLVVAATASAFLVLIMILVGERLATPPPLVVDNRRSRGL
jgi:ABC-type transport system involved in cytochrome bd biosynthesis fused ATPase/permease subunit